MVTDEQVKMLMTLLNKEKTIAVAAAKAGMSEKTARKYRDLQQLPSQVAPIHNWKTRKDPFQEHWPWVKAQLEINQELEAKTLFKALQRDYPGVYQDGQLRTLQRRIKVWRATEGPAKEVFFPQVHHPGVLCQSDYTHMDELNVTIAGRPFNHLIYHFVLTYSNWETGTICFSESLESLSQGLQNALWKLGGVPKQHQTDRLSAAVNKVGHPDEFTPRYQAVVEHYGFKARKIQARRPNENGDIEQSNNRLKLAIDQALMLRGSRDFDSREAYEAFLQAIFDQLNAGRSERFAEELPLLKALPAKRFDSTRKLEVRVGPSSTINVLHNTYSVHSRLIGEQVTVRVDACTLEIWYAQKCVDRLPRLYGDGKHAIDYRHVIDTLIRKPGAFANYRYQSDLFPSSHFRMAYDQLSDAHSVQQASKEYLGILELAAKGSESHINRILSFFCRNGIRVSFDAVASHLEILQDVPKVTDVRVSPVKLSDYDRLIEEVI